MTPEPMIVQHDDRAIYHRRRWERTERSETTSASRTVSNIRPNPARLSESALSFHIGFSAAMEIRSNHFQNKARREWWWSLHIEAWRRRGLGIRKYCRQHRLGENTFRRWLKFLAGQQAARKLSEYLSEWRREKRHEEREKGLRKRQRQRFGVSTDGRNRAMQT